MSDPSPRAGFSLIEVIVAIMILSVGLLGLAAGTGWMISTVHFGELETARSIALQSAVERVRSAPFTSLDDGSDETGDYTVTWTVRGGSLHSREVRFVVVGPGRVPSGDGGMATVSSEVADTFDYRVLRRD